MPRLRSRAQGEDPQVSSYLPTNPPLVASAVAYYRLEEASGTRVDTAASFDLAVSGADQSNVAGKQNNAWNADTDDGWLVNAALDIGGAPGISVSVWVANPNASYSGTRSVTVENISTNAAWSLQIYATQQVVFSIKNEALEGSIATTDASINWVNGNWRHIVATWGAGSASTIYIDGTETKVGSPVRSGVLRDNGGPGIRVGTSNLAGFFNFGETGSAAYMDELAMFDFDVGQAGVDELWNGGSGSFL